jgi:hypothetical protein
MSSIEIDKVDNGYIIKYITAKRVCKTTEELFEELLASFEGLRPHFKGKLHGKVNIVRGEKDDSV